MYKLNRVAGLLAAGLLFNALILVVRTLITGTVADLLSVFVVVFLAFLLGRLSGYRTLFTDRGLSADDFLKSRKLC